ncbi:hypothetical protein C8R44DRAFT_230567 [Mycena epipterygia]|nr:hypothetical protein C8R44DRAFT_230567 [Mycena epipterygia]
MDGEMQGFVVSVALLLFLIFVMASPRKHNSITTIPSPSHSFDVDSTLGALQIGVLVSCVLFGVTTTQTYTYYGRFPKDSRKMKTLVAFVWLCELAHIICIAQTLYVLTISDFAHPDRLSTMAEALGVSTLFNAIVTACVQGFFSFRIFRLSKMLYIPCLTGILSLFYFGMTLVLFSFGQTNPFTIVEVRWGWLLISLWSVAAANDVIIAMALVFWLCRRRDSSHRITVALIDKLITWTIETGVVSSAAAFLNLAFFVTMKENFIWIAFYVVTTRLYSNSFLASLNSRATLRTINSTLPVSVSYPVYSSVNISEFEQ